MPERIVSLVPSATELIYSIGQGHKVVGVTSNDNYPLEVLALPKVGDQTIDLEKVLSLKPDLVVIDSGFNQNKEELSRLGLPILELQSKRIKDVPKTLRLLGRRLQAEQEAEKVAGEFETALEQIPPLNLNKSVFVEVWGEPLMTVGGDTLLSDILDVLGLDNCYKDQSGYFQVDPEDVVSRRPDLIVLPTPPGQKVESFAKKLAQRVGYSPVVVAIDSDLFVRPGPRLLKGIDELRQSLEHLQNETEQKTN